MLKIRIFVKSSDSRSTWLVAGPFHSQCCDLHESLVFSKVRRSTPLCETTPDCPVLHEHSPLSTIPVSFTRHTDTVYDVDAILARLLARNNVMPDVPSSVSMLKINRSAASCLAFFIWRLKFNSLPDNGFL